MPRRSIAEVKVLDVQKRRIPNKHYVSGTARLGAHPARPWANKGRALPIPGELRDGGRKRRRRKKRRRRRAALLGLSRYRDPFLTRAKWGENLGGDVPGGATGARGCWGSLRPWSHPRKVSLPW